MFRRRHLDSENTAAEPPRPPPVRILTTYAELREAIARASAFEQEVISRASVRTRRYEHLASPHDDATKDRGSTVSPDAL